LPAALHDGATHATRVWRPLTNVPA